MTMREDRRARDLPPGVDVLPNGRRIIHGNVHPYYSDTAVLPEAQLKRILILLTDALSHTDMIIA